MIIDLKLYFCYVVFDYIFNWRNKCDIFWFRKKLLFVPINYS